MVAGARCSCSEVRSAQGDCGPVHEGVRWFAAYELESLPRSSTGVVISR